MHATYFVPLFIEIPRCHSLQTFKRCVMEIDIGNNYVLKSLNVFYKALDIARIDWGHCLSRLNGKHLISPLFNL